MVLYCLLRCAVVLKRLLLEREVALVSAAGACSGIRPRGNVKAASVGR